MHVEGRTTDGKIAEIHVNPFSYSYSGDSSRIENNLAKWEATDGPRIFKSGVEKYDNQPDEFFSEINEDTADKLEYIKETCNMAKSPGLYTIVDG